MPQISFVFGFKLQAHDQPLCFGIEGTVCCIGVFSLDVQISEKPEQGRVEGRITLETVGSMLRLWASVVEGPECKDLLRPQVVLAELSCSLFCGFCLSNDTAKKYVPLFLLHCATEVPTGGHSF